MTATASLIAVYTIVMLWHYVWLTGMFVEDGHDPHNEPSLHAAIATATET